MNKILLAFVTIFSIIVSGCQTVQPIKTTASGRPEVTLDNISQEEASGKISQRCMEAGILVYEQSKYQVVCGKTMTGGEGVLAQMLVGNSYSTTPERKVRFTIAKINTSVRIQAYQWIESQMAFGQINRQELNSGKQFNEIQRMLNSLQY